MNTELSKPNRTILNFTLQERLFIIMLNHYDKLIGDNTVDTFKYEKLNNEKALFNGTEYELSRPYVESMVNTYNRDILDYLINENGVWMVETEEDGFIMTNKDVFVGEIFDQLNADEFGFEME